MQPRTALLQVVVKPEGIGAGRLHREAEWTAVGLFQSVVGVIFLLGANALAKRFGERGIM